MRRLIIATFTVAIVIATSTPCLGQTQILSVGPDGQYTTIGAALSDLLAAPQLNNWIKVEAGVSTTENLYFPATWVDGTIWLSGGWDSSFLNQSGDPTDTVISGGLSDRVIDVQMAGGTLIVSDLSIVDGSSTYGSGVRVETNNTCAVRLDNLFIHDNIAVGPSSGDGAGVYAYLPHSNTLDIADCEISSNVASGGSSAAGGGIRIGAYGSADFFIIDSTIQHNDLNADSQVSGSGIYLHLDETATGTVAGCTISDNTTSNVVAATSLGIGLSASTVGSAQLEIARTRILSNTIGVAGTYEQVRIYSGEDSLVSVSDSIVADGRSNGLYVQAADQTAVHATNLTVAANDNNGILLQRFSSGTANVYLSNTIADGNGGSDLSIIDGSVTQTANLIGVNPEFVNPQDLDFRVEVGSIAEDAGVPAPPGGLGVADVRGGIRYLGSAPDAGAHEGNVSLIFSDGFDLVDARRWSATVGDSTR